MLLALVAQQATPTNAALAAAAPRGIECRILDPASALATVGLRDAVVGRLDVLETLDGVDDGLWALGSLRARGVPTLNPASALLGAHDKLLTSRLLLRAGLPHPRTRLLMPGDALPEVRDPLVVKPRFGSWGAEVVLCRTQRELRTHVRQLETRGWFRAHGALVQDFVPGDGSDLRVIVAGGVVVGAIARVASPGEWRTNVSLGAARVRVRPPSSACRIAAWSAAAAGADLIGVDLLPDGAGGFVVLELNGAVEFTAEYSLGRDPFAAAMNELTRVAAGCRDSGRGDSLPAAHGAAAAPLA